MAMALVTASARAVMIGQVDQQQAASPSSYGWWNYHSLAPIGQEFTPTFNSLDVVELRLAGFPDVAELRLAGLTSESQVRTNIRETTLAGALLGTSDTVAFAADWDGDLLFPFSSAVSLTPGNLYVIEVDWVGGSDSFKVIHAGDLYAGGRAIDFGTPVDAADLFFREGLQEALIPEPAGLGLVGLVLLAVRRRRRR